MGGVLGIIVRQIHWIILIWSGYKAFEYQELAKRDAEKIEQRMQIDQRKIKAARKEQELLRNFQENLEASKQRVEEVAQQIESVQRQLPNSISDTEILDSFMSEANSINIKNIFLTPQDEDNRGFYFAKTYQFKGRGTYLQFMIFFERLSQLDRILNVQDITLKVTGEKKKGRFQMVDMETNIEAYRYNAAYREDRGIKEIEEKFKKGKKKGRKAPRKRGKK